jgi:hypothetical protein
MPLLVWFLGALVSVAGPIAGRVLLSLGISFVTYKGFDVAVGWLLEQVKTSFAGMPREVVGFLAYMWVDKAIGMVFAAYTAAIALKAVGGSMTKMVSKGAA